MTGASTSTATHCHPLGKQGPDWTAVVLSPKRGGCTSTPLSRRVRQQNNTFDLHHHTEAPTVLTALIMVQGPAGGAAVGAAPAITKVTNSWPVWRTLIHPFILARAVKHLARCAVL
ncbi:hypothetical protein HYFRA_00006178 [Hymenoscyphus fraxineus]|uniref:Uncharacterized protein n=1 Tax=Hymenoscyphus fraxineus TaxID=746836 RepID=A0A9N9PVQ8_9HELO|nr:hypothetical protein HYFRA_00006178 [Hymenoscyphus fraxineus]